MTATTADSDQTAEHAFPGLAGRHVRREVHTPEAAARRRTRRCPPPRPARAANNSTPAVGARSRSDHGRSRESDPRRHQHEHAREDHRGAASRVAARASIHRNAMPTTPSAQSISTVEARRIARGLIRHRHRHRDREHVDATRASGALKRRNADHSHAPTSTTSARSPPSVDALRQPQHDDEQRDCRATTAVRMRWRSISAASSTCAAVRPKRRSRRRRTRARLELGARRTRARARRRSRARCTRGSTAGNC